jgi:glycosyltransferase involved in cell wall biosynthesis
VFASYADEILTNDRLAVEMGQNAAARSRGYTWSLAAARLRRIYSDLTAGALVECS